MFSESELQLLISGEDKPLDVKDLRKHTKLKGFYSTSSTVRRFWRILERLDMSLQKQLLRFVTSCERAPRLGFASLNPPFCIQCVSISRDDDRLPSSATCFNTLKLPTYSSEKVMREKLICAITSGTGFELA
jgi:ubiquitin-protein ligase E3 C